MAGVSAIYSDEAIRLLARDNPFSTERILALRYRPRGWTWGELLDRLRDLRFRAAIVGPEGSGKTTLLQDLAPRLVQLGYTPRFIGLTRQNRRFPHGFLNRLFHECGQRDIVCFDGSEQMPWLAWQIFRLRAKRLGGLIITIHQPGRLPTLVQCSTDAALFEDLVRTLVPNSTPDRADLASLLTRHHGNIRESFRELYLRFAHEDG